MTVFFFSKDAINFRVITSCPFGKHGRKAGLFPISSSLNILIFLQILIEYIIRDDRDKPLLARISVDLQSAELLAVACVTKRSRLIRFLSDFSVSSRNAFA